MTTLDKPFALPMAGLALALLFSPLSAKSITLKAIDSGAYRSDGAHNSANKTYIAGSCGEIVCGSSGVYRDYFVFDLSALADLDDIEITGAIMTLENKAIVSPTPGGYQSPNLQHSGEAGHIDDVYKIFDVTSTLATVRGNNKAGSVAGKAVYDDLGSGTSYGSYVLTKELNTKGSNSVVLVYNQDGVDALNEALDETGSLFAVGGAFQDLAKNVANQHIFEGTGDKYLRQLTIEYTITAAQNPEPATLLISGSGLLGLGLLRRRALNGLWRKS